MKLISIDRDGQENLAVLQSQSAAILDPKDGWPSSMKELAADWPDKKIQISHELPNAVHVPLDQLELNAPVSNVEKIICIGVNYADHAVEMGGRSPELPVVFNKFPSSINSPAGDIMLPQISEQVDFEAELVVVIGTPGRNIHRSNALAHVFGYCCGIDVTARDWQKGKPGGQWLLGKSFDTFAPVGPAVVTTDEIPDPHNLDIELRLNGKTMQSSNTNQLIFPIDYLIAHLSQFVTLKTGDLLFTGTPSGVGAGRKPPIFLQPGDQLEVEIDGLGVLRNQVLASC